MRRSRNIFWLGTKELRSFCARLGAARASSIYAFSLAIYRAGAEQLAGAAQRVDRHRRRGPLAAVAPHRRRVPAALLQAAAADRRARGRPADEHRAATRSSSTSRRNFERDVLAGRQPGDPGQRRRHRDGAGRHRRRLHPADHRRPRSTDFVSRAEARAAPPVNLVVRIAFNPNVTTAWFTSVMGIINNVTMLAIILTGAAVVREREHGTMEHLLVMPLTPFEIAMAKVWANGAGDHGRGRPVALTLVVQRLLGVPIAGSVPLFLCRRRRSICSSPRRSASSSAPSRAPCRSSGCSTCWSPCR